MSTTNISNDLLSQLTMLQLDIGIQNEERERMCALAITLNDWLEELNEEQDHAYETQRRLSEMLVEKFADIKRTNQIFDRISAMIAAQKAAVKAAA